MNVLVRTAQESDLDAVLALWRGSDVYTSATDDHASIRRVLRHPTSRLLVGDEGGDVVASVVAAWDGWRGSLYRLVVSPAHRRSGLGTRLVRAGEEWLTEQGARRIGLYVINEARGATSFWERCGYVLEPRVVRYVRMVEPIEQRDSPSDGGRSR